MFTLPVLIPGYATHTWLTPDGEVLNLDMRGVDLRLRQERPLVCHGPAVARRLHVRDQAFADILSLFAFVRPARWCVPTPRGVAEALGLPRPEGGEDQALSLLTAAHHLIHELAANDREDEGRTHDHLFLAAQAGWPFASLCLQALDARTQTGQGPVTIKQDAIKGDDGADGNARTKTPPKDPTANPVRALKIWRHLKKWEDSAPPGRPENRPIIADEAEARLKEVLGTHGEDRAEQIAYSRGVTPAFAPAHAPQSPSIVLAEAGTGIGKTLGYLAPALAWRQKNQGPIWLSTYTRNLQRQLDQELDRLYPNPSLKERHVVVRKGRENYLCLMNLEEVVKTVEQGRMDQTFGLILLTRWALASRAGEMIGGDLPGWLRELAGLPLARDLAIRRGECWHGACPHYGTCFAEKMARKSPHAEVVVANHAFVMTQTLADAGLGEDPGPTHFVFDEGHHLFDAADNAYAARLSGLEMRDLRRWILGSERTAPSAFSGRARGLRKRLDDLAHSDSDLSDCLHELERAATILPARGWYDRLKSTMTQGPVELFLAAVATQVYARSAAADSQGGFSLEVAVHPVAPAVLDTARALREKIDTLVRPLSALAKLITTRLEDGEDGQDIVEPTETFSGDQRRRLRGILNSLNQRAIDPLKFFAAMLADLDQETDGPSPRSGFVDWFEVSRVEGRDVDVAYRRHFIDPTEPFMTLLSGQTQGALITSATLTDQTGVAEVDWDAAEVASGTCHLPSSPVRLALASPYDYAHQARVFVVNDLERGKPAQAAAAMARLFQVSNGGALGLFTSIARLKAAYGLMAPRLEAKGLSLMAQHVDAMDVTTLIDIFRSEIDACLLGTDALRDGVDVPGRALRLLVFDRVPWPRPTLAHRARRAHFGPRIYDDRLTRLRLRQAFGRLIRQRQDAGAFVLLDSRLPSRLEGAFPEGVEIARLSLKDTLAALKVFYAEQGT